MRYGGLFGGMIGIGGGGDGRKGGILGEKGIWGFDGEDDWIMGMRYGRNRIEGIEKGGGEGVYREYGRKYEYDDG